MPYARRADVELYYEYQRGAESTEAVVFVSGLGYGNWMWNWQREVFADDYELLFPDHRGTGNSDAGLPPIIPRLPKSFRRFLFTGWFGYSTAGLATDLDAVLADAGLEEVHLVGASLGGMVTQQYALDFDRTRTLSLLCTTPGGDAAVPVPDEVRETVYDVPENAGKREIIRHRMEPALSRGVFDTNPELTAEIIDYRLEQDAGDVPRESQGAAGTTFDVSDRLDELDVPTLILHGSADRVLPVGNAKLLAELIPNSRLEIVDGAPHLFMIEAYDRVNELLGEFFATECIGSEISA